MKQPFIEVILQLTNVVWFQQRGAWLTSEQTNVKLRMSVIPCHLMPSTLDQAHMKQCTAVTFCQLMPVSCSTAGQGTKKETQHRTHVLPQSAWPTACVVPAAARARRHGQAKAVEDTHSGCREDHGKEALQHPGRTAAPTPGLHILIVLGSISNNSLSVTIVLGSRNQPHILGHAATPQQIMMAISCRSAFC
mmetsp:Transcript_27358/g.52761  ORF Transcript_27358/g.52761 Transcript_27358/m.52761 type:complete len:192 (-) Transcript_27358:278-853(-)